MIVYIYLFLQALVAAPIADMQPQADQATLWRDFKVGMTPEEFANNLVKVEGVRSAEVVRKGKKPARVKIAYVEGDALKIGDLSVSVVPRFVSDRLSDVTLSQTNCSSVIDAKVEKLNAALSAKYPLQQSVRVVNDDGVAIDAQRAFHNEETRVTVSVWPIENPYPRHLYGGSGFVAAANALANSLADSAYNDALTACPLDKGRKATLRLQYVSQEEFAREHAKETAERDTVAQATRDGL